MSRPYRNPEELQFPQTRSSPPTSPRILPPRALTGHRTPHWLCPRWSHCKRCPVTVAGSGCAVAGSPVAGSPPCQAALSMACFSVGLVFCIFVFVETGPHVAQASKDDPEFLILCLHLLSAGITGMCVSLYLDYMVLRIKPQALYMLSQCFSTCGSQPLRKLNHPFT